MDSNPVCPVCKAELIFRKRRSEAVEIQLKEGNSIVINENISDNSVDIYCSKDRTHEIGSIIFDRVMQIIKSYGF